jgi:hypothetical protein
MNLKKIFIACSALTVSGFSLADGLSNQWNTGWTRPDAIQRSATVQQANSIALRESDYYKSFSSTTNIGTVNYITDNRGSQQTTTVGSMNSTSNTIYGSNNNLNVANSSTNIGNTSSTIDIDADGNLTIDNSQSTRR